MGEAGLDEGVGQVDRLDHRAHVDHVVVTRVRPAGRRGLDAPEHALLPPVQEQRQRGVQALQAEDLDRLRAGVAGEHVRQLQRERRAE